jgi:hypothetical protein
MVRTAIGLIVWILLTTAAQAEKRIALLIGNQGYGGEIGRLANPYNDIALLEKSLSGLGFEVTIERDASLGTLTRAVNAYAQAPGSRRQRHRLLLLLRARRGGWGHQLPDPR